MGQSARPMAVSLQGPPGPATQLATALATLLFRTRFGRSKLAIPLLPNTLFPTDTAMRMLALRTRRRWYSHGLQRYDEAFNSSIQPGHGFQPFYHDKRLWARQRGLCSPAFYLERWSGHLHQVLKDH